MNESPLLTVIIPVYNVERFLVQCLESVIQQTYRKLQIICINDGSTDGSLGILRRFQCQDPRISVIDQENAGLSAARNRGLDVAEGKYVLFLDSDDWWKLNAVEQLVGEAEADDLDMLLFSSELFFEGSDEQRPDPYQDFSSFLPGRFQNQVFSYSDLIDYPQVLWRLPVTACCCLYDLTYLKRLGLSFPYRLCFEDNLFFHEALLGGGRVSCVQSQLYNRRKHGSSITGNRSLYYKDQCAIRQLEYDFIKTKGDEKLVTGYLQYCGIPQLWFEFRLASLRQQCSLFKLFQSSVRFLLEERRTDELWLEETNSVRFVVDLLQQENNRFWEMEPSIIRGGTTILDNK